MYSQNSNDRFGRRDSRGQSFGRNSPFNNSQSSVGNSQEDFASPNTNSPSFYNRSNSWRQSPGQFSQRQNNSQCSPGNGNEDFISLNSGSPSFYPGHDRRQSGSSGRFFKRQNDSQYSQGNSQEYGMSPGACSPSYFGKDSGNWRKPSSQGRYVSGKNFFPNSSGKSRGRNSHQKKETDISLYMDPEMFEDPWAEFKKKGTTSNSEKLTSSPKDSSEGSEKEKLDASQDSSRSSPSSDESSESSDTIKKNNNVTGSP